MSNVEADRLQVVTLLNDAKTETSREKKISIWHQLEEILIHKHPNTLLPEFLQQVLEFRTDNTPLVRRFLAGFVESLCKTDPSYIVQCADVLLFLSNDANPSVIKKVITATTVVYRKALRLLCEKFSEKTSNDLSVMWGVMTQLKRKIILWIEHLTNDGVRTYAIHFLEILMLTYSPKPKDLLIVATRRTTKFTTKQNIDEDFDLSLIPNKHPLLSPNELMEEGERYIALLFEKASRTDSTVNNISVALQVLFNVAKQRPCWWDKIIRGLCKFASQLPNFNHLSSSQMKSLKVLSKAILLYLLRMLSTKEYQDELVRALEYLETKREIIDSAIKLAERARRSVELKRAREGDELPESKQQKVSQEQSSPEKILYNTPIGNVTATVLAQKLVESLLQVNTGNVPPPNLPLQASSFVQLITNAIYGSNKGDVSLIQNMLAEPSVRRDQPFRTEQALQPTIMPEQFKEKNIMEDLSYLYQQPPPVETQPPKEEIKIPVLSQTKEEIEALTKDFEVKATILTDDERNELIEDGWNRIFESEKGIEREGKQHIWAAILANYMSSKPEDSKFYQMLYDHLKNNLHQTFHLLIQWLYKEYSNERLYKYMQEEKGMKVEEESKYTKLFHSFLDLYKEKLEPNDLLFTRLIIDAPCLTDYAIESVYKYIEDPQRVTVGLITLRDIIIFREPLRNSCLLKLLEYATSSIPQIRGSAIRLIRNQLFISPMFSDEIEQYATKMLEKLYNKVPEGEESWTPDLIKRHVVLFLALCTQKQELLMKLVSVFTKIDYATSKEEPKLTLLNEMDGLIRTLGPSSPALIRFLSSFPNEAEEIALYFVQSLVKATHPNIPPSLVDTIRDIFFKRKERNARFLLPILPYMKQDEIKKALSEIIQLPDGMMEAFFKRILTMEKLTPAELLVALHQLEDEEEIKELVVKSIDLLFSYKQIYTKNVLAIVLQQLVELHIIPKLFMRTLMKSVATCPDLAKFIITILSRLVKRRVWENTDLWNGFIKCVKMPLLQPHSFEAVLQLPQKELKRVLQDNPDLKKPIREYANRLKLKNKNILSLLE